MVGGFTGAEADEWKWRFIDRFNALEADLAAANARYLAALDAIRPSLRPVVKDYEDGLFRSDTAMWLGNRLLPSATTVVRRGAWGCCLRVARGTQHERLHKFLERTSGGDQASDRAGSRHRSGQSGKSRAIDCTPMGR